MVSSIGYSLGIGSGLDIRTMVEGLAEAERAPKEALLQRREEANAAKLSALGEAASAIDSFASALTGLIGGGTLYNQPTVSDTTVMTATAIPGTRLASLSAQIEVVQLAKAQTLESVTLASETTGVGRGTVTLATSKGSFAVTIDNSNNSLAGLAAAINAQDAGVTASIVTDPSGARLVLKGGTGAAQAFTLSVTTNGGNGLRRFAFGPGVTGGMIEAQAAQDAIVKLDGVEVRRATNSFKDLIEGVQIDLKRALPGTTLSLGLARPNAAIEQAMTDFVAAYNEVAGLIAKATAPGINGAGGALRGDFSIREMKRKLAELPSTVLNSQGSIRTLAEIGVATNRDGMLTLNTTRLKSVLESDPAAVEALFNPVQYTSDPNLVVTSPVGKVKPGTYTFTDVVPMAGATPASGLVDGTAATGEGAFLIAPFTSKAVGLVVQVKGAMASATVTIDPGLGGALQAIRDELRARTGPIATSQDRLNAEKTAIANDRVKVESRAKAYYDKLLAQFTAMESRVSAFKATQSYLDQQIQSWNSNND